jgi:hypothetical protein
MANRQAALIAAHDPPMVSEGHSANCSLLPSTGACDQLMTDPHWWVQAGGVEATGTL